MTSGGGSARAAEAARASATDVCAPNGAVLSSRISVRNLKPGFARSQRDLISDFYIDAKSHWGASADDCDRLRLRKVGSLNSICFLEGFQKAGDLRIRFRRFITGGIARREVQGALRPKLNHAHS